MSDTTQARPAGSVRGRAGAASAAPSHGREPAPSRRRASTQWAAWAFLAPVLAYLLVFYALPLYRNLDLSLRNYTVRSFVRGGAPFTGLANYEKVVNDPTFWPAL